MADINSLLDTLFMTRKTPVTGLLSPEEQQSLETQKNIGTALGILTGVGTNYNKGVLESVLGGVTGAVGGRQAPVDYATRNFMTTTELSKMMQDIQKGGLETKVLQGQDIARQAKIKEMRASGYSDTDIANYLLAEKDFIGAELKSNPRFRAYDVIKPDESGFYSSLARVDKTVNPLQPSDRDKSDLLRYSQAVPDKDVAAKEVERATFNAANKGLVPDLPPIVSQSQMLQQILKERSGEKPSTGFAKDGTTVGQQKVVEPVAPTAKTSQTSNKFVPLIDDPNQILDVRATLKKSKAGDTNLAVKSIQDLNRQEKLINDIINSKGFNQAFGFGGATSSAISGSDAAYTKRLLDQLKAKSFVGSIVEMKGDQGSTGFGQLAVSEGAQIATSQSAVDQTLDPEAARVELTRYLNKVQDAKRNLSQDYKTKYGDLPAERVQEKPSFKTDKGVITDAIIGSALPTKILQEYQGQINPNEYYKVVKGVPYKFRKN